MIPFPPSLKAVGGARTGIAPANLLDVLTLNGDLYLFSDRLMTGVPTAVLPATAETDIPATYPVLPVPAGEAVVWSRPTSAVFQNFTSSGEAGGAASVDGGELWMHSSVSLSVAAQINWSAFEMPDLPVGAVITGLYPVVILAAPGTSNSIGGLGLLPGGTPTPPFTTTQLNGSSFGTTLAALAALSMGLFVSHSGSDHVIDVDVLCTFIGCAVYYIIPTPESTPGEPEIPASGIPPAEYLPWLIQVPQISFHRSLQTDFGSFVLQNVSGDTLSRDFEKLMRRATLEGAFFIYRLWQADAEASWIEVHGTLTVEDVGVDTVKLKGTQIINPAQEDTPAFQYCETCQLQWAGPRCGATGDTECKYSFATCQVPERILVVLNDYEKNYGESLANLVVKNTNRQRKI